MLLEDTELQRFLKVSDKCSSKAHKDDDDDKDIIGYLKIYNELHSTIADEQPHNRDDESIMDVIFDGNLYSPNGASRDKYIRVIQQKAEEIMKKLSEEGKINPLSITSLNSAVGIAFTVSDPDVNQDPYYQKIRSLRDGRVVTTKLENIGLSVKANHLQLLAALKNIKFLVSSIVEKNLFSFIWVFLDILVWLYQNVNIAIDNKDVVTLFYVQKYAITWIPESDLISHIVDSDLKFEYDVKPLNEAAASKSIERLADLKAIDLVDGEVRLRERIDIDNVDFSCFV